MIKVSLEIGKARICVEGEVDEVKKVFSPDDIRNLKELVVENLKEKK